MIVCRAQGFTLVELMIAIVIVTVLVLISVPVFTSFIQNYRISASADQLFYYLQYARTESIKRNADIYVSFNTGDTWCYGINIGSACTCNVVNSCGLATVSYSAPQQQSLTTTGLTGGYIYFEGSHSAANASGSVTFTQYGQSSPFITINIGRLGSLSECSTGISGYGAC